MKRKYKLSRMDKKILRQLQQEGRITYAELANRVGLSTSPCLERVKRMEREGVISGYTALLNPRDLNAGLVVVVQIRLARTAQDIFEDFKSAAAALEEVQECYLVSGNFDYLINVKDISMYNYF